MFANRVLILLLSQFGWPSREQLSISTRNNNNKKYDDIPYVHMNMVIIRCLVPLIFLFIYLFICTFVNNSTHILLLLINNTFEGNHYYLASSHCQG